MGASGSLPIEHLYTKVGAKLNATTVTAEELQGALREFCNVSGVVGGAETFGAAESFVGGYEDLQGYGSSAYSKAKEKLIRDIAGDVFHILKLPNAKAAQTKDLGQLVESLGKIIPNPRKGGKFKDSLQKSSGNQRDVCKALAQSINKHYGGQLIPAGASEADVCTRVSEVMHSLLTGLHTEFMTVAGDVLRMLRNMQTLNEYVDASYKKQKELVDASGDNTLKNQASNVAEVYERIKSELQRQMAMLGNVVNVSIGPTGKSLISLLEDNRDFSGLVKDLKADLGTNAFGDKLAYMLSGVSTVAHSAELIDKALKQIGMSVNEFKSSKNIQELRLKIYDHIMKKHPSSRELDKMMAAAEIIYKNDYSHPAINAVLSKKGGDVDGGVDGGCGCDGGDGADNMSVASSDSKHGGGAFDDEDPNLADDGMPGYWSKKSLSTKILKKDKYRELLFKDFRKLLKEHYRRIVDASNQVAKNVGNSIPANDDLDKFVAVFSNLPTLDVENLHVALSGYAKDSASRERREQFMSQYHLLNLVLEPLVKGAQGHLFKAIQTAANDMVKAIDNFSDKIVKSITEIHVDRPDEIRSALKQTATSFFGSFDGAADGDAGDASFGTGSFVAFDKVKMELKYFYSIANIKTNLSRVAEEMADFGDDYEQVLGEEAGFMIDQIKREFLELIENTDPAQATGPDQAKMPRAHAMWTSLRAFHEAAAANKPLAVNAHKNLVSLWKFQSEAKVKMVEVAQAVDLYLRSFADGIARHPDTIGTVVKMLDQVEIVAKWFNDRSGDNLAAVFESFPSGYNGDVPQYSAPVGSESIRVTPDNKTASVHLPIPGGNSGHYYEWLETQHALAANHVPGNPFLGMPIEDAAAEARLKGLRTLTEKTVKSMRALENILSVFSSVGKKFGDIEPQAKTFMNPAQIFNALCQYLTASSFTHQFAPSTDHVALPYHGGVESKQVQVAGAGVDIPANNQDRYRNTLNTPWAQDVANQINMNGGDHSISDYGVLSGVAQNNAGITNNTRLRKNASLAMSAIPCDSHDNYWTYHDPADRRVRADNAGWQDNFYDTDLMFNMVMKSIICKIFTVVDAYRLFHRPTVDRYSHDSLNPLRTILGGAASSHNYAKIMPDALELYLRLPLLAEWYRERFNFRKNRTPSNPAPNDWQLSIVPSIDGTWSGLIRVIFDQADYVEEGNYSENQVQKIIEEINDIYKTYKAKYPKATVRSILNSFVLEMNRVFGFVKQQEIDKYIDNRREYLKDRSGSYSQQDPKDFIDFDILDADNQFGRNPAPSDKFLSVAAKQKQRKQRNMIHLQQEMLRIRKDMDVDFRKVTGDDPNNAGRGDHEQYSFVESLRNYKKELEIAKSDKDQYDVVLRLIQGSNKMINISADKLIIVHEVVAAPLAVLYNIHKVVARYNALLHGASIANIKAWSGYRTNNPALPASAAINNSNDLRNAYMAFLETKYSDAHPAIRTSYVNMFVNAACGSAIASAYNFRVNANAGLGYFMPAGGLNIAAGAALPNDLAALLDGPHLMQDLLAALIDLTTNPNKLVQCNLGSTGAVNVDFSKLEDMFGNLLHQVRSNIDKLRVNFSSNPEVLNRYEDAKYPGSVRWLEENTVEVLFKNRDKCGLGPAHSEHLHQTLNALMKPRAAAPANHNDGFVATLDNAIRGLLFYEAIGGGIANLLNESKTNDLQTFPFNVAPVLIEKDLQTAAETAALQQMRANQGPLVAPATPADASKVVAIPVLAFENDATVNHWNLTDWNSKSLLMSFNKMVHQYLNDNLDDGTLKFYTPLIESFMNSAASREVVQGKAFPNVLARSAVGNANNANLPVAAIAGPLAAPPDDTVLFASTAVVMKALLNTIDIRLKKKRHAYENLAEVPDYMKDRMRCNLPYYSKLFSIIYERADLLKKILTTTEIKSNIASAAGGAEDVIANIMPNIEVQLKATNGLTSNEMYNYHMGLLNRLTDLSSSIKKCCDGVYKELQDVAPYFMETNKDFINDYKQRNGKIPLMPASNVLLPQFSLNGDSSQWNNSDLHQLLLPNKANGSNGYKFNYASRLLLARPDIEPQMDHMPGAKDIYNDYAQVAPKNSMITPQEYSNTLLNMVRFSRFLNDGAVYNKMFDRPWRLSNRANLVPGAAGNTLAVNGLYLTNSVYYGILDMPRAIRDATASIAATAGAEGGVALREINAVLPALHLGAPAYVVLVAGTVVAGVSETGPNAESMKRVSPHVYQFSKPVDQALRASLNLSENSNRDANKEELAKLLGQVATIKNTQRAQMRVYNILDMNIVPLNVHAFMREVPFTNLMNYSYTFDRMVHDFVTPTYVRDLVNTNALTSDNLLIKPNQPVNSTRELMVKLLTYPHADLGLDINRGRQYYALLGSLFNGNDNLKLGRPRYLSDQLWHKVLMTSSAQLVANQEADGIANNRYDAATRPLEAGPSAYEAVRSMVRYGAPLPGRTSRVENLSGMANQIASLANGAAVVIAAAGAPLAAAPANFVNALTAYLGGQPPNYQNLWTGDLPATAAAILAPAAGEFAADLVAYAGVLLARAVNANGLGGGPSIQLDENLAAMNVAHNMGLLITTPAGADKAATAAAILAAMVAAAGGGVVGNALQTRIIQEMNAVFLAAVPPAAAGPAITQAWAPVAHRNWPNSAPWPTVGPAAVIGNAGVAPVITEAESTKLVGLKLVLDRVFTDMPQQIKDSLLYVVGCHLSGSNAVQTNALWNNVINHVPYMNGISRRDRLILNYIGVALSSARGAVPLNAILRAVARYNAGAVYAAELLVNFGGRRLDALVVPSGPVSTPGLKYYNGKTWTTRAAPAANMPVADVIYCAEVGRSRFDTKLVRNLTWFVQLQRIMRVVLIDHLSWINTPVVKGLKIADPIITEYDNNDAFDHNDYTGANYDVI